MNKYKYMYKVNYTSHEHTYLEPTGCNAEKYFPQNKRQDALNFAIANQTDIELVLVPTSF